MQGVALAWTALAFAAISMGWCEATLLSDDAYYYFEIARNAARGGGMSFDSLAPTNGFHPLWAWVLIPVFGLFGESFDAPIRAALVLAALAVAATALVVQGLLSRLGAPRAGEMAAYTWLLNPFTPALAFRGLETPLACLTLALSVAWLARLRTGLRPGGLELAAFGASLGVCVLARTDGVLWAAAGGSVLAGEWMRSGRGRDLWGLGLWAGGAALLTLSPWLVWNLHHFGSLAQSSQQAKQMFSLYGSLPPFGLLEAVLVPVRFTAGEEFQPLRRTALLLTLCGAWTLVAGGAAWLGGRRGAGPQGHRARVLLAPLAVFLALHLTVYTAIIGAYAAWYALPPVLAACLLFGVGLAGAEKLSRRSYRGLALAYTGVLLAVAVAFTAPLLGPRPDGPHRALDRLGASLAPHTRIGLWNAGEVGYLFSLRFPELRVVNLDGVVNNELVRFESEGRYEDYVLEHVDLVIESPEPYLSQIVGPERARKFRREHLRRGADRGGWPVLEVVR